MSGAPTAGQLDDALRVAERAAGDCRCNRERFVRLVDGRAVLEERHHPICKLRLELSQELARFGVELAEVDA